MSQGHFIITGTSRGIGRRLAELLLERGDYVYGISRGPVGELERYERYLHKRFDLSEVDELEPLLDHFVGRIDTSDTNMVCLINNAAVLEPLKHAEKDDPVEIVGVDPGMVDTDMQTAARGQDERFFQMAAFFQEAYREGQLKTTYEVGERLLSIIDTRYESGQILNCLDI